MSYLRRPAGMGQVIPFGHSAEYWLARASRHQKQGETRKAAQLLRHAVSIEPQSADLRTEYALSLQALSCFEASNREALGVLAADPSRFVCYGIIGKNMMALGREQEAIDAFTHYLRELRHAPEDLMLSEDLCDIEDMFDVQPVLRMARYEALLHMGSVELARGKPELALRRLLCAQKQHKKDERVQTLLCLTLQTLGRTSEAIRRGKLALLIGKRSVQAYCALAGAYVSAGRRGAAGATLLRAIALCSYADDEQLYCFSATGLGFPDLALHMLQDVRRRQPDRLPTLYDLCVVLLKMGRLTEAASYIHRCHDLDPVDVPTRCLFTAVERYTEEALPPEAVAKETEGLPFYPLLAAKDTQEKLNLLAQKLGQGIGPFCEELTSNAELYETFLYLLSLPGGSMGKLLAAVASSLPQGQSEKLLRQVLMQSTANDEAKRYAASLLLSMSAKQPFLIWNQGRIAQLRMSFRQSPQTIFALRRLLKRLQRPASDPSLLTHAYGLLMRMTPRQREAIAADLSTWEAALRLHHQHEPYQRCRHRVRIAVQRLETLENATDGKDGGRHGVH